MPPRNSDNPGHLEKLLSRQAAHDSHGSSAITTAAAAATAPCPSARDASRRRIRGSRRRCRCSLQTSAPKGRCLESRSSRDTPYGFPHKRRHYRARGSFKYWVLNLGVTRCGCGGRGVRLVGGGKSSSVEASRFRDITLSAP